MAEDSEQLHRCSQVQVDEFGLNVIVLMLEELVKRIMRQVEGRVDWKFCLSNPICTGRILLQPEHELLLSHVHVLDCFLLQDIVHLPRNAANVKLIHVCVCVPL